MKRPAPQYDMGKFSIAVIDRSQMLSLLVRLKIGLLRPVELVSKSTNYGIALWQSSDFLQKLLVQVLTSSFLLALDDFNGYISS